MDAIPTRFKVNKNPNEILNYVRHDHNYSLEHGECLLVDVDEGVEEEVVVCGVVEEEMASSESDGQTKDLSECNVRVEDSLYDESEKPDTESSDFCIQGPSQKESPMSNVNSIEGFKVSYYIIILIKLNK